MGKKIGVFIVVAVLVCAISMPIFANTYQTNIGSFNTVYKTFTLYSDDTGFLQFQIYVDDFYSEVTQAISTSSGIGQQVHHVTVRCLNTTDYDLCLNTGYFTLTLGTNISDDSNSSFGIKCKKISTEVSNLNGVLLQAFAKLGGTQFDFLWNYSHQRDGNLLIASNTSLVSEFDYITNFYFAGATIEASSDFRSSISEKIINSTIVLQNPKASHVQIIDDFSIADADYNTQQILETYRNAEVNAQNVTSGTEDNNSSLDTIHNQEQQWYSQNQQAIESTGLSNFNFSDTQVSGLNGVFSLFQRLWTSLGDFTFIYVFTLMISFATFVLRHRPSTRSTTKEKKVSSGSGGDSG